ncbi:hypothetical protein KR054_011880 [Drosophila jambulina]|nr:hypothetical protein KR054_011880 [Drosophila jambulina]
MIKQKQKHGEHSIDFLTEEECLAREQRYLQRLQDVRISVGFIKNANKEYMELKEEQLEIEKWNDYMTCDGMPRPDIPPEIRKFVFKLREDERRAAADDISWVLAVNERSILSHDPHRQDLTRRHLEATKRPNIGKFYEETVQRLLQIHKRVERILRNEVEVTSMTALRVFEMTKIPGELHQEIETFFDKLTYRVICSPEAHMTNKGSLLSFYCYNCSNFNFQIWGLQNVPIRFKFLRLPLMYSDLNCIEATLQLPLSVLSDNLTLRCVHTFFDPFSHLAKSYKLNIDNDTSPSCGILEIEDSLMSEWNAQMDIQDQLIMKMESQMETYKAAMAVIEAAEAAKQKKQAENQKGPPVPKAPKMPQAIPEGKIPNSYPLFLKQTRQECTDFFNENFHPDNINLLQFEVNLRRYIIVGGVISMVFVRRPRHTAFEKVNLTLHEDGRVLQVVLDQLDRSRERGSLRPNFEVEATDSDLKLHLEPDELPFYFITFKVPKHLCLWADPLVCQFIEEEIEIPSVKEEFLVEEVDKKNKKKRNRKSMAVAASRPSSLRQSDDAAITRAARRSDRLSSNIYRETTLDIIRKSYGSNLKTEYEQLDNQSAENFALNVEPLSRTRTSLVKQICMPRIISSFKFPQEFKPDIVEEPVAKKSTGPIYRRRLADSVIVEDVTEEFTLNYEDQAHPERLFPMFPEPEDSRKVKKYEVACRQAEDNSNDNLFGLIRTLDGIKEKYEDSPKKLVEQATVQAVRLSKRHATDIKEIPNRGTIRSNIPLRKSGSVVSENMDREDDIDNRFSDIDDNPFERTRKTRKISLPTIDAPRKATESPRPESNKVIHWTTEYILESQFDRESRILTVKTDRLGNFGLAYPRYTHFPFRHWQLEANEENPDELIFTLDTFHVRVVFIISKDGIRGYVTDVPKEYVAKPLRYLTFEKPIEDSAELRKLLQNNNLNVFPRLDANFYVDQGYFSPKHLAAELHTYDAMTVHCKLLKFKHSDWNRLATDRDIVLCLRSSRDVIDNVDVTVRVTPEAATFVEVSELCSENLDILNLHYQSTWRNMGNYTDLHQLINSMNPSATDARNRDALQMVYLRRLLQEIRPLSFS